MSAGCFPGRRHMRRAKAKKRGREMEREWVGVSYTSILTHWGNTGIEWEVVYILSRAQPRFTPSLFADAGCLIWPLAVLIEDDWQIPIHYFSTNVTPNLPSYSCNWKSCPDAMCVKWITDRKTTHIRLKGKKTESDLYFNWNGYCCHLLFLSVPLLMEFKEVQMDNGHIKKSNLSQTAGWFHGTH